MYGFDYATFLEQTSGLDESCSEVVCRYQQLAPTNSMEIVDQIWFRRYVVELADPGLAYNIQFPHGFLGKELPEKDTMTFLSMVLSCHSNDVTMDLFDDRSVRLTISACSDNRKTRVVSRALDELNFRQIHGLMAIYCKYYMSMYLLSTDSGDSLEYELKQSRLAARRFVEIVSALNAGIDLDVGSLFDRA